MNLKAYKSGESALRKVLKDNSVNLTLNPSHKQFVMFEVVHKRKTLRLVYNGKSDNIVAMINSSGKQFIRSSSIYASKLSASDRKMILHDNMSIFRGYQGGRIRQLASTNILYNKLLSKIVQGGDTPRDIAFDIRLRTAPDIQQTRGMMIESCQGMPNVLRSIRHLQVNSTVDGFRVTLSITEAPSTPEVEEDLVNEALRYFRENEGINMLEFISDDVTGYITNNGTTAPSIEYTALDQV